MARPQVSELIALAEEILNNIELGDVPLGGVTLKAARLCRLMNNPEHSQKFSKSSSYISQLEAHKETLRLRLSNASDPNVSISSSNPNQYILNQGNALERRNIQGKMVENEKNLQDKKSEVYSFTLNAYYELRLSSIAGDIFGTRQELVDNRLQEIAPNAIGKFVSAYENLESDNPEDWSNAVHSCRRILQAIADHLFPPQTDSVARPGGKLIKVGPDNYINRLICFVEDHSDSGRFQDIVGSHMRYLGERLDSIYGAANKGSHSDIQSKSEAERYVLYTYMVISDIIELCQ